MDAKHSVKISVHGTIGEIWIDGVKQERCCRYSVEQAACGNAIVHVESIYVCDDVDINIENADADKAEIENAVKSWSDK